MRVYLSSPYEHDRAEQGWKQDVLRVLRKFDGHAETVDPCPGNCLEHDLAEDMKSNGNWLGFYAFCANIVESDLAMLNGCQGILAYLPADATTFGTTHEIIYALERNIPVVLVVPEGIKYISRWLWGILGPNRLFDDVEEAAGVLAQRIMVANGDNINAEVYYPSWQKTGRQGHVCTDD